MADWYASSAAYAAVPQWAATHAYNVGDFVRSLAAPSQPYNYYVFRCTTAGTSTGTEPTWTSAGSDGSTIASGTATFTNVTGRSAHGWSAPAGTVYTMTTIVSARLAAGDRLFVSSDHTETIGINLTWSFTGINSFLSNKIISVNRAGSVPPVVADIQPGATIGQSGGTWTFEAGPTYWQGITFSYGGAILYFNSGSNKSSYFKNCTFVFTNGSGWRTNSNNLAKVIWDNTTVQFGAAGSGIGAGYPLDLTWMNTPSAIVGASIPSTLFMPNNYSAMYVTCRGVDLSAITGALLATNGGGGDRTRVLLDSCRIAPGVTRYTLPTAALNDDNHIELVNCYDGTNVLNERYSVAGSLITDRSTMLSGGAADDIGAFSFKLVSNVNASFELLPLESFWLDVENVLIGSARTATIEVISSALLNNNDISLLLEYMGTSGSSLASFVNSLPSPLAIPAALPTSSATWSLPSVTWNPADKGTANTILSNANLTYGAGSSNTTNDGCRSTSGVTAGKFYFELTAAGASSTVMLGVGTLGSVFNAILSGSGGSFAVFTTNGHIWNNNSDTTITIGTPTAGTVYCYAIDLANMRGWIRKDGGNWNNNATYNPSTNVGGIDISWLGVAAVYALIASNVNANPIVTANFGASAFAQTVPSGFTAGWSPGTKQQLQVPFTPQRAGRVRGLVRLGKVSTTVWVNPQLAIA